MPPVIAAAGEIWEVKIKSKLENQEVLNVLHFSTTGDSDVLNHLLKALIDCFQQEFLPGMPNAFTLIGAVGKRVTPDVGPEIEYLAPAFPNGVGGDLLEDSLPSYCSCVVSIRTTRGGRSGRGRMFMAGIPESSTVGSTITIPSAFWTALAAYIACVVAKFILGDPPPADSWQIGVMSRKLGGPKPPYAAAGFAPATALIPHPELGTTRSRKIGHGN